MADPELEALRAKRLAQLQNERGIQVSFKIHSYLVTFIFNGCYACGNEQKCSVSFLSSACANQAIIKLLT